MRSIETIDVSLVGASTRKGKAAAAAGDIALAVLLALALPLGLIVLFSPVIALVRLVLTLTGQV